MMTCHSELHEDDLLIPAHLALNRELRGCYKVFAALILKNVKQPGDVYTVTAKEFSERTGICPRGLGYYLKVMEAYEYIEQVHKPFANVKQIKALPKLFTSEGAKIRLASVDAAHKKLSKKVAAVAE